MSCRTERGCQTPGSGGLDGMGIRAVDVRLEDRGGVMLCGGGRCRVGRRGDVRRRGAEVLMAWEYVQ